MFVSKLLLTEDIETLKHSTDTSAIGIGTTVLYSILQPISSDTGIPLATLNAGTGYSEFVIFASTACVNYCAKVFLCRSSKLFILTSGDDIGMEC